MVETPSSTCSLSSRAARLFWSLAAKVLAHVVARLIIHHGPELLALVLAGL